MKEQLGKHTQTEMLTEEKERKQKADELLSKLKDGSEFPELGNIEISALLANDVAKKEFIDKVSETDYLNFLVSVNGVLRGVEPGKRGLEHEPDVKLEGFVESHIPPKKSDRKGLLIEALKGAKTMSGSGRSLEDIGLLLGATINDTHAFVDGNGRTSRFIYTLMTEHDEVEEKLSARLSIDGSLDVDINPSFVRRYVRDVLIAELELPIEESAPVDTFSDIPTSKFSFQESVPDDLRVEFTKAEKNDRAMFRFALLKHAKNAGDIDSGLIADYPRGKLFLVDKFAEQASPEQMKEVVDEYWTLKKRMVELLIDVIVNPEKPEYQVEKNDEMVSILYVFKNEVESRHEDL